MALDLFPGANRNILAASLIAAFFFLLQISGIVQFHEAGAVDLRILLRGRQPARPEIVLVEIDNESLTRLGPWPWKPDLHARLLEKIQGFEPRFILYNVLFTDASHSADEKPLVLAMEKQANVLLPFLYHSEEPLEAFFPIEPLRETAREVGFLNLPTDPDGHVRRMRMSIKEGERDYYSMAVLAVLAGFRDEEAARQWLSSIPVNARNEFWINYPGPVKSFKRVSADDILLGSMDEAALEKLLKDRIVIIGQTSAGSVYLKPAVFSPLYPEIAVHASAIHTLLSENYLRQTGPLTLFSILMLLCLLVAVAVERFLPRNALIFTILMIGLYLFANYLVFRMTGILLPFFVPVIAAIVTYVTLLFLSDIDIHFRGELLGRELATASGIQASFLATTEPSVEGLDVFFQYSFASHVGGDFYDWIDLGGGRLGVAVGDVSGKGVPAAIYMVRAISEFRRENRADRKPSEVIATLNQLLATRTYAGMFLTMTYVIIDSMGKQIHVCSAGHEPLVFYHSSARRAETVKVRNGPPIGLFTDSAYQTTTLPYEDGDVLFLLSDGVTELRNPKGAPLATARVQEYLELHARDMNAKELVHRFFEYMDDYRKNIMPHDDRTVLAVKMGKRF